MCVKEGLFLSNDIFFLRIVIVAIQRRWKFLLYACRSQFLIIGTETVRSTEITFYSMKIYFGRHKSVTSLSQISIDLLY